ncbi:hypothetical protein GORBP_116_00020 [Gordonia rubripertincta NBRC 101908]|uniref:Uncharacterized protein n=1 Tax=Gordonia rubripertincta NBRC 101908 TaxID=1077975 RepID=A0ABQ0I059_GORRU|nr:hypothetical protein GORBP_116_00020 [Gordonia rubripertincta NBRC 101908]
MSFSLASAFIGCSQSSVGVGITWLIEPLQEHVPVMTVCRSPLLSVLAKRGGAAGHSVLTL